MAISVLPKSVHAEDGHIEFESRLASVGVPQSVVEVRIGGSDDQPVMPGEMGEVLVRGDTVMNGYWNNPAATATSLKDGWLHTGDIGVMDCSGFITLKDRSKDVIISGGSNIYPREVEEILLRHPGVAEVSVIGRRDPEWRETVVAFVACVPGQSVMQTARSALHRKHRAVQETEGIPVHRHSPKKPSRQDYEGRPAGRFAQNRGYVSDW